MQKSFSDDHSWVITSYSSISRFIFVHSDLTFLVREYLLRFIPSDLSGDPLGATLCLLVSFFLLVYFLLPNQGKLVLAGIYLYLFADKDLTTVMTALVFLRAAINLFRNKQESTYQQRILSISYGPFISAGIVGSLALMSFVGVDKNIVIISAVSGLAFLIYSAIGRMETHSLARVQIPILLALIVLLIACAIHLIDGVYFSYEYWVYCAKASPQVRDQCRQSIEFSKMKELRGRLYIPSTQEFSELIASFSEKGYKYYSFHEEVPIQKESALTSSLATALVISALIITVLGFYSKSIMSSYMKSFMASRAEGKGTQKTGETQLFAMPIGGDYIRVLLVRPSNWAAPLLTTAFLIAVIFSASSHIGLVFTPVLGSLIAMATIGIYHSSVVYAAWYLSLSREAVVSKIAMMSDLFNMKTEVAGFQVMWFSVVLVKVVLAFLLSGNYLWIISLAVPIAVAVRTHVGSFYTLLAFLTVCSFVSYYSMYAYALLAIATILSWQGGFFSSNTGLFEIADLSGLQVAEASNPND